MRCYFAHRVTYAGQRWEAPEITLPWLLEEARAQEIEIDVVTARITLSELSTLATVKHAMSLLSVLCVDRYDPELCNLFLCKLLSAQASQEDVNAHVQDMQQNVSSRSHCAHHLRRDTTAMHALSTRIFAHTHTYTRMHMHSRVPTEKRKTLICKL